MVGRDEGHYLWFTTGGGDSLLVASSSRQASVGRRSGGPPKTRPFGFSPATDLGYRVQFPFLGTGAGHAGGYKRVTRRD